MTEYCFPPQLELELSRRGEVQLMRPLLLLLLGLSLVSAETNDSDNLLWGAYRPGLYFGLRPQLPQSLMTGLLWFGVHDYQSFLSKHSRFIVEFEAVSNS